MKKLLFLFLFISATATAKYDYITYNDKVIDKVAHQDRSIRYWSEERKDHLYETMFLCAFSFFMGCLATNWYLDSAASSNFKVDVY